MKKYIVLSLMIIFCGSFVVASEGDVIESNNHCYDWFIKLLSYRFHTLTDDYVNGNEDIDQNDL